MVFQQIERDISAFIDSQRSRFSIERNNKFATQYSKIAIYREYLEIVSIRYATQNESFIRIAKCRREEMQLNPGEQSSNHALTENEVRLLKEQFEVTVQLHLEIESFFLFAKILLDHIASAFQFYFNQARDMSLRSHDKLVKNLSKFCAQKNLASPPKSLLRLAEELKSTVCDFRDYAIAHDRELSEHGCTVWSLETEQTTIARPAWNQDQLQSKPIPEILPVIDSYLGEMLEYIKSNEGKAHGLEVVSNASH